MSPNMVAQSSIRVPGLVEGRRGDRLRRGHRRRGWPEDASPMTADTAVAVVMPTRRIPQTYPIAISRDGSARSSLDLLARFATPNPRFAGAVAAILDRSDPDACTTLLVAALSTGSECYEIFKVAELLLGHPLPIDILKWPIAGQLVQVHDGRVRFEDPAVPGAVTEYFRPSQVRTADQAWTTVLVGQPTRSIWHRAQAAGYPDEGLAHQLELSARESDRVGDPRDSLRRLYKAARLSPQSHTKASRLIKAGQKAFEIGLPNLAETLLMEAQQSPPPADRRAAIAGLRAQFGGRVARQLPTVSDQCRSVARLIEGGSTDAALDQLVAMTQTWWWADRDAGANGEVLRCLDLIPEQRQDPRFFAACARVAPERTVDPLTATTGAHGQVQTARLVGLAALATGDLVTAADLLGIAADGLREQGLLGLLAQLQAMRTYAAVGLGHWATAALTVEEAIRLSRATSQRAWELRALGVRAVLSALRGEPEHVRRADADEVERAAAGDPTGTLLASVQVSRGISLIVADQWTDGYDTLRSLFDENRFGFNAAAAHRSLGYLAEAALHAGRAEDVRSMFSGLAAAAATSKVLAVSLSYARAVLAPQATAAQDFGRALDEVTGQWPWLRARLELAYGIWLRRQGQVTLARTQLQSARHTLERLEARSWHRRAEAELRAAGVHVGLQPAGGHAPLSPQELQISRLAAVGLTNREIGARLFLSPRTIGSHLYRIFPKLDITARSQIAERLGPLMAGTMPIGAP